MDKHPKPNFRRRIMIAGGAALLTAAGVGGYAALSAPTMHLVKAATNAPGADGPESAPKGPDTDTQQVQQGSQNQAQDSAPDSVASSGAETSGAEADGPGGHSDAPGSAGQDGDFNN